MGIKIDVLRNIGRLVCTSDLSNRKIADLLRVAPNTVGFYRRRIDGETLTWKMIESLDDLEFVSRLRLKRKRLAQKVMPDWKLIYERLMTNKHLTLEVLHEEYKGILKERAYGYSQFTFYYRKYLKKLNVSMKLRRYPGEVTQVDFAGTRIPWKDPKTGKVQHAEIFVAVLPSSNYTFACAVSSQNSRDFITAHVKAFNFFGGVTECVIPDNLKSGVTRPGIDPAINQSYQDLADFYVFVVLPARVRKPKDKGSVESHVRLVSRRITAPLLERTFFSVDEINDAMQTLLPDLNAREMKDYGESRTSRFERLEKSKLRPLPVYPFEYFERTTPLSVSNQGYVKVLGHFYSVPFTLDSERVDPRVFDQKVEIYHNNVLVASHKRSHEKGESTTDKKHMHPKNAAFAGQGLLLFLDWAKNFGPYTEAVIQAQYKGKRDDAVLK